MLILDPTFKAALSKSTLTLCWCWLITRTDGAMLGFTSFDIDLVIGDVTYRGITGFDPTASQQSSGLEKLDSQNLKGILDVCGISRAELESGLWDGAEVRKFVVDWTNLPENLELNPPKHREFPRSYIASKKFNNLGYELQTKDVAAFLEFDIGRVTSKKCQAKRLGDDRCRKDLTNFTHDLAITNVINRRTFVVDGGLASGYFDYGRLQFTSGANDGIHADVMLYIDNQIILGFALPYDLAVGDTLTAVAGCDRSEKACVVKFRNFANYVGEPRVPTSDTNLNTP